MKTETFWPKTFTSWIEDKTLYVSVPFTWNMITLRRELLRMSFLWKKVVIGGPGVYLTLHYYPDFLDGIPVEVGQSYPGVLQRINSMATRTTTGCIQFCEFCGIGRGIIEPGGFRTLPTWPSLPVITDNNILAAPLDHFERIIQRLIPWGWADFEQGLDVRLLSDDHARMIALIDKPTVRLALDSQNLQPIWLDAILKLREAGIAKANIRSYALIGFNSDPGEAWDRCNYIEAQGIKALPMWYHRLDALKHNIVTDDQKVLGWTDYERRRIMQWFYQHKKAVKKP